MQAAPNRYTCRWCVGISPKDNVEDVQALVSSSARLAVNDDSLCLCVCNSPSSPEDVIADSSSSPAAPGFLKVDFFFWAGIRLDPRYGSEAIGSWRTPSPAR